MCHTIYILVKSLCTQCIQDGLRDHGWGIQRRNAIFRSLFDGLNDSVNNSIRSFALDWHFDDKENSSHLSNLDSSLHAGYVEVLQDLPRPPNQTRTQDDTAALQPLFTPEPHLNRARFQEANRYSAGFFVDNVSHTEESEDRSEVSDYFIGFGLEQEQPQTQSGTEQITVRPRRELPLGDVTSQLPGYANSRTHESYRVENTNHGGSVFNGQQSREVITGHRRHNNEDYSGIGSRR